MSAEEVEEKRIFETVVRTLDPVFISYSCKLNDVLHESLPEFKRRMFVKSFISESGKSSSDFGGMMKEFKAGWPFLKDVYSVECQCWDFLGILKELGGPPSMAANELEREMRSSVEKKVQGLNFLSKPRDYKSYSTPGNVVYPKPKIDRSAYSEGHPHNISMEDHQKNVDEQDGKTA